MPHLASIILQSIFTTIVGPHISSECLIMSWLCESIVAKMLGPEVSLNASSGPDHAPEHFTTIFGHHMSSECLIMSWPRESVVASISLPKVKPESLSRSQPCCRVWRQPDQD